MRLDLKERFINPPPGSKLAAARDFGVDLTLLWERLQLSPEERLRDLQGVMDSLEKMRAAMKSGVPVDKAREDRKTFGE